MRYFCLILKEVKKEDVCAKVEKRLRTDKENAYTIAGLMTEVFDVKDKAIENKPFKDWDKGLPTLYTRIRLCLEKLKKQGKVDSKKHSKAWIYWWTRSD